MDSDTRELLEAVKLENKERLAYIAGVSKGFDLMDIGGLTQEQFETEVREGFQEYKHD